MKGEPCFSSIKVVWIALVLVVLAITCAACGSSDSTATKQEEINFRDRNPDHIHAPPPGFGPSGGPGSSGPPKNMAHKPAPLDSSSNSTHPGAGLSK